MPLNPLVLEALPLKQGLKLELDAQEQNRIIVLEALPLKQGLKLDMPNIIIRDIAAVLEALPLKQGLKRVREYDGDGRDILY